MATRWWGILWGTWAVLILSLVWILVCPMVYSSHINTNIRLKQSLATQYCLTDYCLSTESRHVRHLSLPEWVAPFQDLPAYHEHFPSSSFLRPYLLPK